MTQLLRSLFDIALLRKDPSVLPASIVLLVLAGAAFAVSSAALSWLLHGNDRLAARTALDLAFTLVPFWLLLAMTRRGNRFRQTMTAVFGATALVTPFVIGVMLFQQLVSANEAARLLVLVGSVAVIVWYTLIVGHILKSALEIGFVTSIAIALTWLLASDTVAQRLFAGSG